jgi:hypothetical protein
MSSKMLQSEKLKAQAATLQAKMDALQERIREAEAREKVQQDYLQRAMQKEVARILERYQKRGLRADFRLVKGPFLEDAALEAAGMRPAEVVVAAAAAAARAPPPKSDWQKWCFDHVKPLFNLCERNWESNLFSVARQMREANHDRYWDLVSAKAGTEPLQQVEVQAAVDAHRAAAAAARWPVRPLPVPAAGGGRGAAVPAGVEAAWARVRAGLPREPGDVELLSLYDEPLGEV